MSHEPYIRVQRAHNDLGAFASLTVRISMSDEYNIGNSEMIVWLDAEMLRDLQREIKEVLR